MLEAFESTISEQFQRGKNPSPKPHIAPNYIHLQQKFSFFRHVMKISQEILKNKTFVNGLYQNLSQLFKKERRFIEEMIKSNSDTSDTVDNLSDFLVNNLFIFKENFKICLPFLVDDFFKQFKASVLKEEAAEKNYQVSITETEEKKLSAPIGNNKPLINKKALNLSLLSGSNNKPRSNNETSSKAQSNIKIYSQYSGSPKYTSKRINILDRMKQNARKDTMEVEPTGEILMPQFIQRDNSADIQNGYFDESRSLGFRSKERRNFISCDTKSYNASPDFKNKRPNVINSGGVTPFNSEPTKAPVRRLKQKLISKKKISEFAGSKHMISINSNCENSKKTINNSEAHTSKILNNQLIKNGPAVKISHPKSTFLKNPKTSPKFQRTRKERSFRPTKYNKQTISVNKNIFHSGRGHNPKSHQSIHKNDSNYISSNPKNYDILGQRKLSTKRSVYRSRVCKDQATYKKSKTSRFGKKKSFKQQENENLRRSLVQIKSMKNNLFGFQNKNILSVKSKKSEQNKRKFQFLNTETKDVKSFLKSQTIFSFKAKERKNSGSNRKG